MSSLRRDIIATLLLKGVLLGLLWFICFKDVEPESKHLAQSLFSYDQTVEVIDDAHS